MESSVSHVRIASLLPIYSRKMIPSQGAHEIFVYLTGGASLIFNGLAIFVVLSVNIEKVGLYRYLLVAFSIANLCISAVHSFTVSDMFMGDNGFIMIPTRLLHVDEWIGTLVCLILVTAFNEILLLSAYQFVYRYINVCDPPEYQWARTYGWRMWTAVAGGVNVCYMLFVCIAFVKSCLPNSDKRLDFLYFVLNNYGVELDRAPKPGFMAMEYWYRVEDAQYIRGLTVFTIFVMTALGSLATSIIFYCAWRIHSGIEGVRKSTKHVASSSMTSMNSQLFWALVAQTSVTGLLCHLPTSLAIYGPFFNATWGGFAKFLIMMTALPPVINPLLLFACVEGRSIRDLFKTPQYHCHCMDHILKYFTYRRAIPSFIGIRKGSDGPTITLPWHKAASRSVPAIAK